MLYLVGFLGRFLVPKDLDTGITGSPWTAVLLDLGLLLLFAGVHSVMARPAFKGWLSRFQPAALERSTYTLVSSLLLVLLFWLWRPLPAVLWQVEAQPFRGMIVGLSIIGWLLAVVSFHTLGHFDLFGLRQAWRYWKDVPYEAPGLSRRRLYRRMRHPVYAGFLLGCWATPTLTQGHLLFAVVVTVYIAIGLVLEERDLEGRFGEAYRTYRAEVPRLWPRFLPKGHQVGEKEGL